MRAFLFYGGKMLFEFCCNYIDSKLVLSSVLIFIRMTL